MAPATGRAATLSAPRHETCFMNDKSSEESSTFEHNLAELESIVEQLESGELELADSMEKFKRGVELSKSCRTMLDEAQQTIEEISASANPDATGDPAPDETSD
jgi:exodeoxyribonuclease VII small subunit